MILKTKLFSKTYSFNSLKEVLAKANEEKSGDKLAGIAATSYEERIAAKIVLSQLSLKDCFENPIVDYDKDEVTRIIIDDLNLTNYEKIKNWTIENLREYLLASTTGDFEIKAISNSLTSEMIAAVTKLMSNMDLVKVASKIEITKTANTTIGKRGTFSARLQPNHPTDDIDGILASIFEGLSYGSGDAVIGLNPVDDSVENVSKILNKFEEIRSKYEIPTQTCVLAHVKTQMKAIEKGAPTGLIFQSIAGSQKGNTAFGFEKSDLEQAQILAKEKAINSGKNKLYFETGQGSELSSNAHYGADQLTMEARCYGFARHFDPFMVNTVVGFIGPEYLYDGKQVIRAGLEDHFMGKLHGLSMGVDVCYTNHMKADQNDADNLLMLLNSANVNFVMGIPHADDVMLNYQSTSYHDVASIREISGKGPTAEFEHWLEKMGIMENKKLTAKAGDASIFY